ncbi:MAG: hypothetical protein IPJ37_17340 [Bacteroidales bacterium]|nr:hypothetical protein [Bacteroidales bacterium]
MHLVAKTDDAEKDQGNEDNFPLIDLDRLSACAKPPATMTSSITNRNIGRGP